MRLDTADTSLDGFEVVLEFQIVEQKAIEGATEFSDEGRSGEVCRFGGDGGGICSRGRWREYRCGSVGLRGRRSKRWGRRGGAKIQGVVRIGLVVEPVGPGGETGCEVGEEVQGDGDLAFAGNIVASQGEGNGREDVRLGQTSIFAVENGEDEAIEVGA